MAAWVAAQPPWSDFPFILLTEHGGGLERNPAAARLVEALGNVTFLERPFHPTTLVSVVQTGLRGRDRQYECRRLNEELESRVAERTAELATANRQLIDQIKERESVESTLRQMQRLEAVGQLTSGVAHDFNNLLTVVLGNLGFVEKGLDAAGLDGKLSQRLGYMRSAAERGAKLTDQLLSFSRRQRLEPKPLDLNETVVGMRDLLQSTMGGTHAHRNQAAAQPVVGDGRPDAARARRAQSRHQCPRRHAGRRQSDGGNRERDAGAAALSRRSRQRANMSASACPIPAPE